MTRRRMRTISALAALGLVVGALAGGAEVAAAKKKRKKRKAVTCQTFVPGVAEAAEAEVLKVTDKHRAEAPLVIDYEHAAAGPSEAGLNETLYFNVQSYSKLKTRGLFVLQEFEDHSDLDLYVHDAAGEEVASSGAFNPAPVPGVFDSGGSGGTGFESVSGLATDQCGGYTIVSNAYLTPGTPATLKIWLANEIVVDEEG